MATPLPGLQLSKKQQPMRTKSTKPRHPLSAKAALVNQVTELTPKEIFVILEGGMVHEIKNLPPGINVTVLDYDLDGVEAKFLKTSPVDGQLCVIRKW